jgi:hypothetical protein
MSQGLANATEQSTVAAPSAEQTINLELPPPFEDERLETLVGSWAGLYTMAGVPFHAKADVRWAFNHQYVMVINHSTGPIGATESAEIWQASKVPGDYKLWSFDPWGNAGLAEGKAIEDGFLFTGDDPLVGKFRNKVTWNGRDHLLLRMESGPDENGGYRVMGDGFYRRVEADGAAL